MFIPHIKAAVCSQIKRRYPKKPIPTNKYACVRLNVICCVYVCVYLSIKHYLPLHMCINVYVCMLVCV